MTDGSSSSQEKIKNLSLIKKIANYFNDTFRPTHSFEEEITDLIEKQDALGNHISEEGKEMIHNAINYGDLITSDIMIPRVDISALPDTANLDDFKDTITKNNFTRIPIYHDNLDNVIGFVNVKDLLPLIFTEKEFNIKSIMREILVVSPTMKLIDLIVKMKLTRIHIAVVVDDYGGTDGLITFEDLVEEIVGDVEDEFDEDQNYEIIKIKQNLYATSGRAELADVSKKTKIVFNEEVIETCDTIGGYLLHIAGHVPKKGEIIRDNNAEFEITESNPRTVTKILIRINDNKS